MVVKRRARNSAGKDRIKTPFNSLQLPVQCAVAKSPPGQYFWSTELTIDIVHSDHHACYADANNKNAIDTAIKPMIGVIA